MIIKKIVLFTLMIGISLSLHPSDIPKTNAAFLRTLLGAGLIAGGWICAYNGIRYIHAADRKKKKATEKEMHRKKLFADVEQQHTKEKAELEAKIKNLMALKKAQGAAINNDLHKQLKEMLKLDGKIIGHEELNAQMIALNNVYHGKHSARTKKYAKKSMIWGLTGAAGLSGGLALVWPRK